MKQTICILIFFLVISELNGFIPNRFEEWLVRVNDEDSINQVINAINLIDGELELRQINGGRRLLPVSVTTRSFESDPIKLDLDDKWELIYHIYGGSRTFAGQTIHFESFYIANSQIVEILTSRELLIEFGIIDTSSPPIFFLNAFSRVRVPSSEYLILTDSSFRRGSETSWNIRARYYFRKVNE